MSETLLPVLRRSAIQTAKACLYRYKKIWVDGVPDDNVYSLRGIGFHAAAHQYIERLAAKQLTSDEEEARAAFVDGISIALTPAPLVPEIRSIFMRWAELFQLDLNAYLGAEERQKTEAGHTFVPDLVYARPHELEIVDFKTYFYALTEDQLRADWQARWYMYAARRVWKNFPSYRFTHSYVRFGRLSSVVFTERELDGFADEVAAVAGVIAEATRENNWPATPGEECRFCQLRCPVVDRTDMAPKRIASMDQAVRAGELILAGERLLKTAKSALKSFCAIEGPVDVGGVEWANRPSENRWYLLKDVLQILQDRGRMGAFETEELTLSHSALAALFKAFPDLEKELAPLQRAKTIYRFSAKKPGVGDDDDE